MKYRIRKVTYKDGEVKYFVERNRGIFFWWTTIAGDGSDCGGYYSDSFWAKTSRERCLELIDLNFAGKDKKESVEIEYIIK